MNYDEIFYLIRTGRIVIFFFGKQTKKFIPPGTVQITESLFADETEISNHSWREYEFWVKTKYGEHSKEHLAVLPDTLVWRQAHNANESYVKHYYRHVAYKDYPVVGISHSQAQAFCTWRTQRVKEYYMITHKKELFIEYRLPSKEEWELLSNNGGNVFSNKGWDKRDISSSIVPAKRLIPLPHRLPHRNSMSLPLSTRTGPIRLVYLTPLEMFLK